MNTIDPTLLALGANATTTAQHITRNVSTSISGSVNNPRSRADEVLDSEDELPEPGDILRPGNTDINNNRQPDTTRQDNVFQHNDSNVHTDSHADHDFYNRTHDQTQDFHGNNDDEEDDDDDDDEKEGDSDGDRDDNGENDEESDGDEDRGNFMQDPTLGKCLVILLFSLTYVSQNQASINPPLTMNVLLRLLSGHQLMDSGKRMVRSVR